VIGYENHAQRLAEALRDGLDQTDNTLALLESCTGGLIASLLTDVPGAGNLLGSGVAYSPEAKQRFGVSGRTISIFGLASPEVAREMAHAALTWFDTSLGLGITGVAGPEPEDGVQPGTAFAAVCDRAGHCTSAILTASGDRAAVKRALAAQAIGLLLEHLERPEAKLNHETALASLAGG
jgi:PncC family amidohydrolase